MKFLQNPLSPDTQFGVLFHDVQMQAIFEDSKTFADCLPTTDPEEIMIRYESEKLRDDFRLDKFIQAHFRRPPLISTEHDSQHRLPTAEHISRMWPKLTRNTEPNSSLLPVPYPYIVPGGRFRELYYWDSYFTMLGLRIDGQMDLVRGMIENFAHLIDTYGHIPNANRTYFLDRAQPPFFALMLRLLAAEDGPAVLIRYLPHLHKEYMFWMDGSFRLDESEPAYRRVVLVPDFCTLNRYWDDTPAPRPESYREDVDLVHEAIALGYAPESVYRHVRAACESGWDFSSRWMSDARTFAKTKTCHILPVDLNCLLYVMEQTMADAYRGAGEPKAADLYDRRAENRAHAIRELFWSERAGFFMDLQSRSRLDTGIFSLAGLFPLYVGIATPGQAERVHEKVVNEFLQPGGVLTSLHQTGQQWDSPNGWAPLQWIAYRSLTDYGFVETARLIRERWLALNDRVFQNTGKLMEKYNVVDTHLDAGGGEYPNQDGFGWTNGVYLALKAEEA